MKKFLISFLVFLFGCGSSDDLKSTKKYGLKKNGSFRIFGDSVFATSDHRIKKVLESHLKKSIIDHSVSGAWTKQIKQQYINVRDPNIQIAILNGGGNDVFGNSSDCKAFNEKCKKVVLDGVQNHRDLFAMMSQDGVNGIAFLGFHYTTGWNAGYEKAIDYAYPLIENLCSSSEVPCVLIDPRQKFKNTSGLLEWDGTHPNWKGTEVLAGMIYEKMQDLPPWEL